MNVTIPSVAGAADMELQGIGQRDGADQGDPQVSAKTISNDGSVHVGVWECTPGGWPIVDRGDTEVASIVSGRGIITDSDGAEQGLAPRCGCDPPQGLVGPVGHHRDPAESVSYRRITPLPW